MTLGELLILCPPAPGHEVNTQEVGEHMLAHRWFQPHGGKDGWFWAVSVSAEIFAFGWTGGDHVARDLELGAALAAGSRLRGRISKVLFV